MCRSGEEGSQQVPKELWFLCDMMTSLGLGQEQLFLSPGSRHSADLPPTTTATTQCCGSGMFIADPRSEFSPSRIRIFSFLEPGSEFFNPGSRTCIKEFTHPRSRSQGSKRHRIPDPDPQHCHHHLNTVGTKDAKVLCLLNERRI